MSMFQPQGVQSLLKEGGKHFSGVDEALVKNIEACKDFAKIVQTSFGPNGTSKLVVNHLNKHFVTTDTGIVVKEIDIAHPCGRMLAEAAKQQEFEVGDGRNLVVTLAGAVLSEALDLVKEGLHSADVLKGYEMAMEKALDLLDKMQCWRLTDFNSEDEIKKAVSTTISAKHLGQEADLSGLVAKAIVQVINAKPADVKLENYFNSGDCVRIAKVPGGSLKKSFVVDGMVVCRDTMGAEKKKVKAKVAVYGNGIDHMQTEAKGTVLLENAQQLMDFSKGEEASMERFVQGLAEMGVSVVISGGAVNDIALHFLDKYGILVVKIQSKFELRRFCKTLKAINIIRNGPPLPEELGYVDSVVVQEIASQKCTIFKCEESKIATIVLRGATPNQVDEWGRAIEDAVNCIKNAVKDNRFCAGGGSTEIRLAHEIQKWGQTISGLDQYAVLKFGEAFETIPKILCDNAGYNKIQVIGDLYSAMQKGNVTTGVNVDEDRPGGSTIDSAKYEVFDHLETKKWAIRYAMEAALTVLRVEHIVMAKQAGGPKA